METPRDAATVVLLRPAPEGFEAFLVRRHSRSGFMGGAHVFPGGKLDDDDQAAPMLTRVKEQAQRSCIGALEPTPGRSLSAEQAVGLYVAACRELFEEAGVLLARGRRAVDLPDWRVRLNQRQATFGELLGELDAELELERLHYFAHWVTPSFESRRFDARFFLVAVPREQTASEDAKETTESTWLSPRAALEAHATGALFLPPPTRCVLLELDRAPDVDAAVRAVTARPVVAILPKVASIDDELFILLPWDPLYATTEGEALPLAALPSLPELGPSRLKLTP